MRVVVDTAIWSLATLQRAVREAPDGLPQVSTGTIRKTPRKISSDFTTRIQLASAKPTSASGRGNVIASRSARTSRR